MLMIIGFCLLSCIYAESTVDDLAEQGVSPQSVESFENLKYYASFEGDCIVAKINGQDVLYKYCGVINMATKNGRVIFIFMLGRDGRQGGLVALSGGFDRQPMPNDYWLEIDTVRTENAEYQSNGECRLKGNVFKNAVLSCRAISLDADKYMVDFQYRIEGVEEVIWME